MNLKRFIADLDVPVIAGGVADYRTAMHLMRTGAAGVIVGHGHSDGVTTTDAVLGIGVPMATAIVDAAAARRDYLDETGGRYVHVIADGGVHTSGDIAKSIACGADAVMLGEPLSPADECRAGACTGRPPPRTRRCRAAWCSRRRDRPRSTCRRCCSGRPVTRTAA